MEKNIMSTINNIEKKAGMNVFERRKTNKWIAKKVGEKIIDRTVDEIFDLVEDGVAIMVETVFNFGKTVGKKIADGIDAAKEKAAEKKEKS